MSRIVKVHNVSENDIRLSDSTVGRDVIVPAFGYASIPYHKYIQLSIDNDLSDYRLKVDIAQETVKKASVTDFGAKGNGLDNDTQAIQRAIDYITSSGGGVVDIPVGVYVMDNISVTGNVMLQGESREDSVLKMRLGGTGIAFEASDGGADRIRLIGPSSGEYSIGISVDDSPTLSVTNCSLVNVNECVLLYGESQLVIENCLLAPKRYGGESRSFYGFDENSSGSSIVESFCSYE